ncbi:signal peptidase I [Enterococcus alishanensis]|uniref:Signal peptidase I n=1 Tax=Enterococcus alishanensis TaxID=1303817 RepID=A0ABS6T951_9ENTE|nr:signal peptidase I [Enterococcus alishanensis]MBV7389423.1 signal peptidase I [Enterococcus alishanensis]
MESSVKKKFSISGLIGKILLVIMIPLLIMNCYLLYKSYANPDIPPQIFGKTPLIVQSGSMDDGQADSIKVGDLVIVDTKTDGQTFQVGDVITYEINNEYITHEVISIQEQDGEIAYQTQGRANNTPDQNLVTPEQVLGSSTITIPKLGDVLLFLQTPIGLVITVGIPILLFLAYDRIRSFMHKRKGGTSDEGTEEG